MRTYILSAGAGRTGSYIAIDYLIEEAKTGYVDVLGCLKNLRQQRTQMIQTLVRETIDSTSTKAVLKIPFEPQCFNLALLQARVFFCLISSVQEQYRFVYGVLLDQLSTGDTVLRRDNYKEQLDELKIKDRLTGKSKLHTQFEVEIINTSNTRVIEA